MTRPLSEAEKVAGFITAVFNALASGSLSLPEGTTLPVGAALVETEGERTSIAVQLTNNACLSINVMEVGTFVSFEELNKHNH